MKKDYTPIACGLVDHIEEVITLRKSGTIIYLDEHDNEIYYDGKAKTWETRADKAEYLILENGESIRLDRLISLFGKPFSGLSC